MEVKCENCKYAVSNSGRPCREIVGRCSEYKEFVSVEEKPMEHQCKDCKHNHLNDGNEDMCSACSGYSDKFEPIEEKPMEKKYRVLRDYILNLTLRTVLVKGRIYNSYDLEGFAIYKLINQEYIEEVKENTLESIIDNNFIGDEIKKNLEQCIVKQKIELLYAIRSKDEPIGIAIDDKISELEKEIK